MDKNPPTRQASRLEYAFFPGGRRFLKMSRSFSGGGAGIGLWVLATPPIGLTSLLPGLKGYPKALCFAPSRP